MRMRLPHFLRRVWLPDQRLDQGVLNALLSCYSGQSYSKTVAIALFNVNAHREGHLQTSHQIGPGEGE